MTMMMVMMMVVMLLSRMMMAMTMITTMNMMIIVYTPKPCSNYEGPYTLGPAFLGGCGPKVSLHEPEQDHRQKKPSEARALGCSLGCRV